MSSECPCSLVSCHTESVSSCHTAPISSCHTASVSSCHTAPASSCHTARAFVGQQSRQMHRDQCQWQVRGCVARWAQTMGSRWGWHNRPRRVAGVDRSMISLVIVIVFIDSPNPQSRSQPQPQTDHTFRMMTLIVSWDVLGGMYWATRQLCSIVSPVRAA